MGSRTKLEEHLLKLYQEANPNSHFAQSLMEYLPLEDILRLNPEAQTLYQKALQNSSPQKAEQVIRVKMRPEEHLSPVKFREDRESKKVTGPLVEHKMGLEAGRCRHCGSLAIPGSDQCYSCSSD